MSERYYVLGGYDDDSYMLTGVTFRPAEAERYAFADWRFGSPGAPHPATCGTCGGRIEPEFLDRTFRVKKRRRDVTVTYDGYLLVSSRFREFCFSLGWSAPLFRALPADSAYWWLSPIVSVSCVGRRLRECPSCGNFADVVGPELGIPEIGMEYWKHGAVSSDLQYGSVPLQGRIVIVREDWRAALMTQRFIGLDFSRLRFHNVSQDT